MVGEGELLAFQGAICHRDSDLSRQDHFLHRGNTTLENLTRNGIIFIAKYTEEARNLRGVVNVMDRLDNEIASDLKARIATALPAQLRRLIVFGSRARGDGATDSDLDVIALVATRDPEIERRMDDIAYSVMWDHDFRPIISLKVFSESQFTTAVQEGFSFYRHVLREGVTV
jgi:uncharacterized protein